MVEILVNGIRFDPGDFASQLEAATGGDDHVLLLLDGPLTASRHRRLQALGVELWEYLGRDCYLGRVPEKNRDAVGPEHLDFIAWAGPYAPGLVASPHLAPRAEHGEPLERLRRKRRQRPDAVLAVQLVCHWNVEAESLRQKVAAAAEVPASALKVEPYKIRLRIRRSRLARLARLPEVRYLEPMRWPTAADAGAVHILRTGKPAGEGAVEVPPGLDGHGEIVALCDTGLDRGEAETIHEAFAGRVLALQPFGRKNKCDDLDGHGTHCAALAVGAAGLLAGKFSGVASGARLVFQSVNKRKRDPFEGIPGDLRKLLAPAYALGARVHSNSWNENRAGSLYNETCSELDDFVWNHRDLVVVFAAGNSGLDRDEDGKSDAGTVRAPAVAKNCLAVGASKNVRPEFEHRMLDFAGLGPFPVEPLRTERLADDAEDMAPFSGRGPTRDERIKPDLVAPGTCILSAFARDLDPPAEWGASPAPGYGYLGGTSMATALVAGCAAVVRQFLKERHARQEGGEVLGDETSPEPSAALVKALLIHGARPLAGNGDARPNRDSGWGRVSLELLAAEQARPLDQPSRLRLYDEGSAGGALGIGQEWIRELPLETAGRTLEVTLVWTDFPGRVLQNDLDLIVQVGESTCHGNRAPGEPDFDRTNNVEQVVWPNCPAGTCRITVRGHRVLHGPQPFALVVSP